MKTNKY